MSRVRSGRASAALRKAIGRVVRVWRRRRRSQAADVLSAEERDVITAQLAAHAAAVASQVQVHGDVLADGDVLLRERLRRVEQHLRLEC